MDEDIRRLYANSLKPSFEADWDDNLSLGKNLVNLLSRSIYNVQYPEVIISYSFLNTRLCQSFPLLVLQGSAGTGKSTCLDMVCKIRGLDKAFACGQSTYASLRNYIEIQRNGIQKDGVCLLLDNLQSQHLTIGEPLYNFLLTGYDEKTSKVSIASNNGENIDFDTFAPKVISTVYNLYQDSSFSELQRRLLLIEFHKHEPLFIASRSDYDLSQLPKYFLKFWCTEESYKTFFESRSSINHFFNENLGAFSDELITKKEIMMDLITTSFVIGLFETIADCVMYWSEYLEEIGSKKSIIDIHLKDYIDCLDNDNLINLSHLKQYISALKSGGYIDSHFSFKKVKEIICIKFNYKETKEGLKKNG